MGDERPLIPPSRTNQDPRGFTLLFFVTSVVVFVTLFAVAGDDVSPALLAGAVIKLVLVWLVLHYVFNVRQFRRFLAENNAAVAGLSRGEIEHARDVFWRWSATARLPVAAALARHNLGCTLIRLGKLEQAAAILEDNDERHARALRSLSMSKTSAACTALAYALLGELDRAEQWMGKVEARARENHLPSFIGDKAIARAVIDCRTGRSVDAARMLDERWQEYEAALTGDTVRPLRVIRAFAHASDIRNVGVAETILDGMRPRYRGDLDYLGVAWPEMATFLAAHGLATEPVPPAAEAKASADTAPTASADSSSSA